jgi:glyoxylase-like metal-dependent hydrolase (beta-lactamase superfamily II)
MSNKMEKMFEGAPIGATKLIAPGTHAVNAPFWGFPNVIYFLESGDKWALIDTGVSETPKDTIGPFLEEHGGFESLELVLGTHGHIDHVGGNSWVKERAPQAKFGLGTLDAGWAEDVGRHYCQLYQYGAPGPWEPDSATEALIRDACGEPVAIDYLLQGGEVLSFGAGREIETMHLGAHSPGQMLYIDRLGGCVFSGDAIQQAGVLNSQSNTRDFPMYRTVSDYLRSLEKIRSEKLERLCTGHAGIYFSKEADAFIDSAITWSSEFTTTVREAAVALVDFSLEQMVARIHEIFVEYAVSLQIRVTTAEHLDELVRAGVLLPRIEKGEKRWSTQLSM